MNYIGPSNKSNTAADTLGILVSQFRSFLEASHQMTHQYRKLIAGFESALTENGTPDLPKEVKPAKKKVGRKKYPFGRLKVGDDFFVAGVPAHTVAASAYYFNKQHNKTKGRHCYRYTVELRGGRPGTLVTRVA